jgi:hypothetical protein
MPDLVVAHIPSLAASEGFTRGIEPDVGPLEIDNDDRDMQLAAPLPDMMSIDDRNEAAQLADHDAIAPAAGVDYYEAELPDNQSNDTEDQIPADSPERAQAFIPTPTLTPKPMQTQHLLAQRHGRGVDSLQSLQKLVRYSDTEAVKSNIEDQVVESAFTISVTAAFRDRRDEATPVT